jgi:DNA-binding response OmpR family regulator
VNARHVWVAVEVRSIQVVVERVLKGACFHVERIAGAGPLLERLARECPDLLVLDRGMLDTVVRGLPQGLRWRDGVPAVIVISEAWDPEDLTRIRLLGVGGFVRRPVRASELLEVATRLLASRPEQPAPPPEIPDVLICGFGTQRHILADELVQAGYTVRGIPDGLAAGRIVATGDFRSLLLDMEVPAREAVLQAIGLLARPRAILSVGRIDWGEADRLRRLGVVTFLEKPVQVARLLAAMEEVLGDPLSAEGGQAG